MKRFEIVQQEDYFLLKRLKPPQFQAKILKGEGEYSFEKSGIKYHLEPIGENSHIKNFKRRLTSAAYFSKGYFIKNRIRL